jgi:phosphate transport system substrate-binding protein
VRYRIALLLAGLVTTGLVLALPVMAQTTLNGAGATFPYPMYSKWFSDYNKLHPDVQINYQSIGSGGGIHPGEECLENWTSPYLPSWCLTVRNEY